MIPEETGERRADLKSNLLERLHDPVQLRICAILAVLLVGYVVIYLPLSNKVTQTSRNLDRDRKRLKLARSLEELQEQYHEFADRVPKETDSNEWVQYLLEGTRQFSQMRVLKLDRRDTMAIGPYKAMVLEIEIEGSFPEMDKFLEWVEANQRMLRVDKVNIAPTIGQDSDAMVMKVTVLAMTT